MEFNLKSGAERAYQIADHNLRTTGFVTFTIDDVNEDKPIQWSVIGARKNELITSEGKKYAKQCRVWVQEDQWTPADGKSTNRIVNVSAICTESGANKVQSEVSGKLTITITPEAAVKDFYISQIEAPESVVFDQAGDGGNGSVDPAAITIKAHVSPEDVPSGHLSGFITVDVTGHHHTATIPMTVDAVNEHILEVDIADHVIAGANGAMFDRESLDCTYTIDVFRTNTEETLPDHHHTGGGKLVIKKK